jgi:hypothetical protein
MIDIFIPVPSAIAKKISVYIMVIAATDAPDRSISFTGNSITAQAAMSTN